MKYKLNLSEFDKGWLAAGIDFEGYISICKAVSKKRIRYGLYVGISCTHKGIIEEAKRKVGLGSIRKYQPEAYINKGYKPCYHWYIQSNQALAFLKQIEPYLIIKREQAKLAIQFQEKFSKLKSICHKGRKPRQPFPKEIWDWKEFCYLKMKELNQ